MPAPDFETLFDVETAVEAGLKALLVAENFAAPGYTSREYLALPERRIDIQCALGQQTGHRHADRTGKMWLDAWQFRLTLGVVTPRDDSAGVTHGLLRAKLRIFAQYASGKLDDRALFPYHVLTQIQAEGSTPIVATMDDCDVSEISFSGVVSIHRDAWPVA